MDIKRQYDHGKLGNFLFDICAKISIKLYKIKFLYWFLQFTWGLVWILVGLIVSLVLICCGQKPIKTPFGWRFEIGKNWGGCDLGIVYIRDKKTNNKLDSLDMHEMGHCLTQNLIFGPLFIFCVAIPSAARYWIDTFWGLKRPYDAAWFEDLATVGGEYFCKIKNK